MAHQPDISALPQLEMNYFPILIVDTNVALLSARRKKGGWHLMFRIAMELNCYFTSMKSVRKKYRKDTRKDVAQR